MEELPARAYRKTNERYVVNAIAGRQARSDVGDQCVPLLRDNGTENRKEMAPNFVLSIETSESVCLVVSLISFSCLSVVFSLTVEESVSGEKLGVQRSDSRAERHRENIVLPMSTSNLLLAPD